MNNKFVILTTCILLFSHNAFSVKNSESHSDTIHIMMPNEVTIESKSTYNGTSKLSDNLQITDILSKFLKRLSVLNIKKLNKNKSAHFKFSIDQEYYGDKQYIISIVESNIQKRIIFPEGKAIALMIKGNNKVELNSNLTIYFNTLKQLEELQNYDFLKIMTDIDMEIHKTSSSILDKVPFVAWFKVDNNNNSKLTYQRNTSSKNKDQIIITGGGVLNQPSDYSAAAGFYTDIVFQFSQKAISKEAFSIGYEWTYGLKEYRSSEHWINLGYSHNYSKNQKTPKWYGVSFAYAVAGYSKNPFRIGINHRIHKHVSIGPQLYLNKTLSGLDVGIQLKFHL